MIRHKTVTGVLWNFLEQLSKRGISILVTLLLARFLLPDDFGMLAMMSVFVTIASALMDSGIKQAVIRKKDASQIDFNTAFYTNLSLGILAYFVLFISAPYISDFYDEERLTLLLRVAGLVVFINSFQVIQSAILSRELNFKLQLKASVPASIISGITAVLLAYYGAGVWALVTQMLLSALLLTMMLWWLQQWRPSLTYSLATFKEIYGFGYKLFLASLIRHISRNIYVLVIASLFGSGVAGLYFFASSIKELVVSQLVSAVQKVTYPALATMQDDNVRLKSGYRKVLSVTTFILFPSVLMLATLAQPIFEVALPERWHGSIVYLQLMCLSNLLYPLHAINLNILKVKGRSDIYLGLAIYKNVLTFLVLFVSYRYGVIGILVGQIILSVLAYIPNSFYSKQLIGYSVTEQVRDCIMPLSLSLAICLPTFLFIQVAATNPLSLILIVSPICAICYIFLSRFFAMQAYNDLISLLYTRLKRRKDKHA
ncbi:lipopolysaccharide biosynthesis protein [Halomonas alkalisoli]|uniref:lipopolysaccharide biosynthesis protein n=1 Tax=Halomonas alkalisoli TaxID=2907158 RepID=UPI001F1DBB36|nr:lipopolysaccharide biosynthesis protein [Halomonas alkalisoli]MCE9683142.1 lipopolysaccharide biosynthesis protein [Halomonas alkalisoli]